MLLKLRDEFTKQFDPATGKHRNRKQLPSSATTKQSE